ncbi:hypothetical protein CDL15_Pgr003323 [Punica granatum]|uniref:Serine carboxypeptidase-like 18 n=1 Tax=Punica granatum TaxID=22663 RepID=A0A218X462_PUNGR|nr:hypothetical protein CDL15_Pgr003323 [Punica granatum]
MRFILLVWFLILDVVQSQSVVKTLPGFSGELPFKLETGYIGVGQSNGVQLFYYFVESERSPRDDPLMIWLTGGPGCSGLAALLYEIGPLRFDYAKSSAGNKPTLALNPYSWTKVANIIFLDQFAGAGFSYSTTQEGYYNGDYKSIAEIYEFLRKWFRDVHPEFLPNPLYISGGSYTGLTIPVIIQHILDDNRAGQQPQLNLKGYVLGNPLADVTSDLNLRITFAHGHALISDQLYESLKKNCKGKYVNADPANVACALDLQVYDWCVGKLFDENILEPHCRSSESHKPNTFQWARNNLGDGLEPINERTATQLPAEPWCREHNYILSHIWANAKIVQEALYVREGKKTGWMKCNISSTYAYEIMNVMDYHQNFTRTGLQALIYSGDHDSVVPYVATEAWIERLNISLNSEWEPWFVDGQVAGSDIDLEEMTDRVGTGLWVALWLGHVLIST